MTVTVQNTLTTSTFDFWRNRTNELATAMSTVAVTVNSNTAAGDAAISGTFTANALYVSNGTSNIAINPPTTSQKSSGQYFLNANNSWTYDTTSNGQITTTGTSIQNVDSWSITTWNLAEYMVSVVDNAANNFYATKMMVTHNSSNAFITEYSSITSNSSVGVFSANANATHVVLTFTPVSSNTTVKYARTLI
jgi:hypothetical protein